VRADGAFGGHETDFDSTILEADGFAIVVARNAVTRQSSFIRKRPDCRASLGMTVLHRFEKPHKKRVPASLPPRVRFAFNK
jgi:hypothetical protein